MVTWCLLEFLRKGVAVEIMSLAKPLHGCANIVYINSNHIWVFTLGILVHVYYSSVINPGTRSLCLLEEILIPLSKWQYGKQS